MVGAARLARTRSEAGVVRWVMSLLIKFVFMFHFGAFLDLFGVILLIRGNSCVRSPEVVSLVDMLLPGELDVVEDSDRSVVLSPFSVLLFISSESNPDDILLVSLSLFLV